MTFQTSGRLLWAAAIVTVLIGPAAAADATIGALKVSDPWARATVGPGAGAAFFAVSNTGGHDDKLVSAAAPFAQRTELHTHVRDGEVMRMRQVEAIDLPAGATTTLQPGGLHVMFLGMNAPLEAGTTFPLTLSFAEAGSVTVEVQVRDVGAMSPSAAGSHGDGHGAMGGHGMPEHKAH